MFGWFRPMRSCKRWLVIHPRCGCTFLALVLAAIPARAELVRLDIRHRAPYAGGRSFGAVGTYAKLTGVAHFAVDPHDSHNAAVVDLPLAPRNSAGKVEFAADVLMLVPKDLTQGN